MAGNPNSRENFNFSVIQFSVRGLLFKFQTPEFGTRIQKFKTCFVGKILLWLAILETVNQDHKLKTN